MKNFLNFANEITLNFNSAVLDYYYLFYCEIKIKINYVNAINQVLAFHYLFLQDHHIHIIFIFIFFQKFDLINFKDVSSTKLILNL